MENFILMFALIMMFGHCDQKKDEVHLDAGDSGQEVKIAVETEVQLSLDANPGTGYRWSVTQIDSSKLSPVGEPVFKTVSEQLGGPAQQILRFKPKAAGTVILKLIYHRPWEKAVAPADTFEVTLHITDGK